MESGNGSTEGRTWERGGRVQLLRPWFNEPLGSVGTIIDWIPKQLSHGNILFVEWQGSETRFSIEDDLVSRVTD